MPNPEVVSALRRTSVVCGVVVLAIGLVALAGWVRDDELLKSVFVPGINLKFNTAVGLVLLGGSLLLVTIGEEPAAVRFRLGRVLAAIAALLGLATLSEHLFGWDLGIDQFVFHEAAAAAATQSPNRMGPPASICFPLLGLSIVFMSRRAYGVRRRSQVFALAALLISTIPILGYLYRVHSLYGVARYTGIALNSAIAFFTLAVGVLFARPLTGPLQRLVANDTGGMLIRRLLPGALLLPILLGALQIAGEKTRLFDAPFSRTMLVFGYIVVFSFLTWWTGTVISRHEQARLQAEQAEHEMKDRLLLSLEGERTARAQAEHSNRMKDEFLATLSHELRTPLNSILGWAVMLLRGGLDTETARGGLESIDRNAKLQAQLIEDLLDMSRIVAGKIRLDLAEVRIEHVVHAALAAVAPAAQAKSITIGQESEAGVPVVRGDAVRLQQVLWNLLSNAIKFTPHGGRVFVTTRLQRAHVDVEVTDSGIGIPSELLGQVFERFSQADGSTTRRHGGLGLGLAIARQLAELHGGSLEARSEGEGRGATFVLRLPIAGRLSAEPLPANGSQPAGNPARNNAPAASLAGARVLVVDDQPDARELIERVLAQRDALVTTADGVTQALELLETVRFDLLVSDIGMPERDGYELIRALRLRGGSVPAIALTAFARVEDRDLALSAGYEFHLAKPVDPAALLAVAERLLARGAHRG